MSNQQFFSHNMARTCYNEWNDDDDVHLVLDQHAYLDFYSGSSLKQQSAGRHVAPLGHIHLIQSQPVLALTSFKAACCSKEARNTNFVVFGLNRTGFEPTNYNTPGEHVNNYTINVVLF